MVMMAIMIMIVIVMIMDRMGVAHHHRRAGPRGARPRYLAGRHGARRVQVICSSATAALART
jgi:hypothetical protein